MAGGAKPVCVPCKAFYKCKKNEVVWEEMGPFRDAAGVTGWRPYKLYHADLWECQKCGNEIIIGTAIKNFAEHYQDDYEAVKRKRPPYVSVEDC